MKGKSISITESLRTWRIGNLEAVKELSSFSNIWSNNERIYLKVEDDKKKD